MIRNESDTAWKQVLEVYFKDFVEYCLPELYSLINWDKHWTSLDKELNAITKGSHAGKRLLDKLFRVYLKDGQEQWVLVHLEVQGAKETDFPKRMFTYSYRIYDKYQKPVMSCAILTDENKSWRPSSYQIGLAGSHLGTQYVVIKLIGVSESFELEYKQEVYELEEAKKMAYISRIERYGIEQGVKQGLEQGIEQVARHLLEEDLEISLVVKTTGLPLAKIKKLQSEIKQAAKSKKR